MENLIAWIIRAIPFGTIIMYGAMGEILTEKSGNLNLGVPGIMYLGGFAGFASSYYYEKLVPNPNDHRSGLLFGGLHAGRADLQLSHHHPSGESECNRSRAYDFRNGRG